MPGCYFHDPKQISKPFAKQNRQDDLINIYAPKSCSCPA